MLKRLIIHPIAFAAYPILALLAHNLGQVNLEVVERPLIFIGLAVVLLLGLTYLFLRNLGKAGLVVTWLVFLFFTYGHFYHFAENTVAGPFLGRHRYLAPVFLVMFLAGLWMLLRKVKDPRSATLNLNLVGLFLLAILLFQITSYYIRDARSRSQLEAQIATATSLDETGPKPDIYYFILDGYTRGDVMWEELGFDNTPFLEELEAMGFYVASCSRSNYSYTVASMVTSLNMDYMTELISKSILDSPNRFNHAEALIKKSRVRKELSALGYKLVAFETGFEFIEIRSAEVFLKPPQDLTILQTLQPFEAMLIDNSAALVVADLQAKLFREIKIPAKSYVKRQTFVLNELYKVPDIPGPKFVYTHIIIPHYPYVFRPNGEILRQCATRELPTTNKELECLKKGYTDEVKFLNSTLIPILQNILKKSDQPPVIILQGDHGIRGVAFNPILNAYYLPGEGVSGLYSTISPVNTFRLVFDTYFGTNLGFLPDHSYLEKNFSAPIAEEYPQCR